MNAIWNMTYNEIKTHTENCCREADTTGSLALSGTPKNWADDMDLALENFFLASSLSSAWSQMWLNILQASSDL